MLVDWQKKTSNRSRACGTNTHVPKALGLIFVFFTYLRHSIGSNRMIVRCPHEETHSQNAGLDHCMLKLLQPLVRSTQITSEAAKVTDVSKSECMQAPQSHVASM